MTRLLLLAVLLSAALPSYAQRVLLTGIVDGDATGGLPKAIELYVEGTVDLTPYTVVRYSNGSTTGFGTIDPTGVYTDRFVYLTSNLEAFAATFGTSGDFSDPIVSGNVSGNGNDVFELQLNGTAVDQTGGSVGDGSNVYQDGYLYRIDGTGPTPAFDLSEWTGGNGVLDGLGYAEMGAVIPFGTYQGGASGPTVSVTATTDLAEPATDGGFTVTLSEAASTDVTITYVLEGTATESEDYTDTNNGSLTIAAGSLSATVELTVLDDNVVEGDETVDITLLTVSDPGYSVSGGGSLTITDNDLEGTVLISTVQGDGFSTPLSGETVTVEAIVVGDFTEGLRGFYLQEEDADSDGNPATSEGIFVFEDGVDVSLGDLVRVTGRAGEFSGQTQISAFTVELLATGLPLPTATTFTLPLSDPDLEALEGMRIAPEDLVVTENFNLARFGEVTVTSDQRLIQFTECNEPDAAGYAAYNAEQNRDVLLIDDGRNGSNVTPILLPDGSVLSADNTLRSGETIENLIGVLGYGFNQYRIQPTEQEDVVFTGNDRPDSAPEVGGEIKVVSANVLNYFTTLNSRGADNQLEFERQQAKIVAGLCELDGDIVGLIEIENNDYVALENLIAAIASECGTAYSYVVSPNTGTDQIMVALIYRPDRVTESGTAAALATPESIFVGPGTNRVPLAQTFRVIDPSSANYGQQLTVAVNHFKSKGSGCGDNVNDGAGECNTIRDAAARELTQWLATYPTGVGEEDILIVGDLNSYRMEDPIQTILEAGYFSTTVATSSPESFPCGGGGASYVFQGEWGSLDYILASNSLADAVTGAANWAVNAPEPPILDYNLEFNGDEYYAPDFYRFSDHDPIVVGLDLGPALTDAVVNLTATAKGNKVQLRWKTTSDIEAGYFAVERLQADGTYITIGTVKISGGNSNGNRQYVFNDQNATAGENTYRLRVVSETGTERYTEPVTATLAAPAYAKMVSTTAPGVYRVADYDASTTYTVVNMGGAILQRGRLMDVGGEIRVTGFPAGMYLLYLTDARELHEPIKLLVP